MSGILGEAVTPCPSRSRSSGFQSGSDTFDSFLNDDIDYEPTGQIDFTTEIKAPTLKSSRPRRANCTGSVFQIHEEVAEKSRGQVEKRKRDNGSINASTNRKSSLLAQPAQRFRPKVNFAPSPPRTAKQKVEVQPKPESATKTSTRPITTRKVDSPVLQLENTEKSLKKDVRRNTVYIPPDDTTVASVFMDLFSPMKKDALPQQALNETRVDTLEKQIAKRQARKSLAVSARRAPLQPSDKIAQEAAIRVDIAGKNGGKENIPPGALLDLGKKNGVKQEAPLKPRVSTLSSSKPMRQNTTRQLTSSKSAEFRTVSVSTKSPSPKRAALSDKKSTIKHSPTFMNPKISNNDLTASKKIPPSASLNARASALADRLSQSTSNRSSRIGHERSSKLQELNVEYPKLAEDIAKPALYEDDWLTHQETVIAQLCNSLFEYANGDSSFHDQSALRLELLEIYHTEYFVHMYHKIQASLSCGTLSMSKETLVRNNRLRRDVGLRRKFLDIWINSYDNRALTAALETVIGRQVSNNQNLFGQSPHGCPESPDRRKRVISKKLEGFLDTFLLRNDDLDDTLTQPNRTSAEIQANAYRRTVLRCIMLIALLDKGKQSPHSSLPRKLFTPTSSYKSSVEVLQAITRIVLPSCGDIVKSLNHLGCRVSYQQHQLQNFNYQVGNIAVDLRDGVRLTRIVEVLFFGPHHMQSDSNDQTVTLNTGEVLSLLGDQTDVPLSKHLKFPCVSRAAKIFNVQIALSSLRNVKGSTAILKNVRAEEIVDGYREKTISLLWALVSKWGLAGLVDWEDLKQETARLKRKAVKNLGHQVEDEAWFTGEQLNEPDEHARALHQWTAILAALKNLKISNMTTSFSDGKIYESIVDEYQPYIMGSSDAQATMSLDSRLRLLSCDSQFAHLVSPGVTSPVLDRDFTLGALAFLCSRLLSASKTPRAATILQRAWRARLAARDDLRRTIAKNIAEHCAAVVRTRNEILWAKEVITRWWRHVQSRKQKEICSRTQSLHKQSRRPAGRRL